MSCTKKPRRSSSAANTVCLTGFTALPARLPPKWERAENLHTSHPALYRAIALQGIRIDKDIKSRVQADKLIDTYVLQVREDAYQAWQSYEQGQSSA